MAADLDAVRQAVAIERSAIERVRTLITPETPTAFVGVDRLETALQLIEPLVAEVEELRRQVQAQRRVLKAAVATLMAGTDRPTGPLRTWQTAFRLGRAGLRLDSKHVDGGHVYAWYKHPQATVTGATLHALCHEVGRR